jgi:phosphohistidine phosphatase
MNVLVFRHGNAMERDEAQAEGIEEAERPLTRKGRSRTREVAKALSRLAPEVVSMLSSPYRRAVETALIVGKAYDDLACEETPALLPEAHPEELCAVLGERSPESTIVVVGHEPHLGQFIGYCLTGSLASPFELKKAGVCLMHFDQGPKAGAGRLSWFLPPRILRRVGARRS